MINAKLRNTLTSKVSVIKRKKKRNINRINILNDKNQENCGKKKIVKNSIHSIL